MHSRSKVRSTLHITMLHPLVKGHQITSMFEARKLLSMRAVLRRLRWMPYQSGSLVSAKEGSTDVPFVRQCSESDANRGGVQENCALRNSTAMMALLERFTATQGPPTDSAAPASCRNPMHEPQICTHNQHEKEPIVPCRRARRRSEGDQHTAWTPESWCRLRRCESLNTMMLSRSLQDVQRLIMGGAEISIRFSRCFFAWEKRALRAKSTLRTAAP